MRWLLVLALGVGAAACSDSTPSGPDPCGDEAPPTLPGLTDAVLNRASFAIEERAQYASDGTRTNSTSVSLALVDLTTYKVESRFPAPCCGSMACFLLTGSPVQGCRGTAGGSCGANTCSISQMCVNGACVDCVAQRLEADKVTIEGLGGGLKELAAGAPGTYLDTTLASPLYAGTELKVTLTGRTDAGYFPSYTQSLQPPDPLVLETPDPTQRGAVSKIDMPVRWTKGNGDWVELTLRSSKTGVTDKVVCIARDDGCATVPVGAIESIKLDMLPGEQIQLILQRSRVAVDSYDATTGMQLKASSRVEMLLDQ